MENYKIVITPKIFMTLDETVKTEIAPLLSEGCKNIIINPKRYAVLSAAAKEIVMAYRNVKGKANKDETEKRSCLSAVHIFHRENKLTKPNQKCTLQESSVDLKALPKEVQQRYKDMAEAENIKKNEGKVFKSPEGTKINPKTGRPNKIKPETVQIPKEETL